jgi:mannose-6-phosphate isomerase-like protein (cupin superfamily)
MIPVHTLANTIHGIHPDFNQSPVHLVNKKWGTEYIITNSERYCTKFMILEPKTSCSMHFHKKKAETFVLCSGELTIETIRLTTGEKIITTLSYPGDSFSLEPGTPHRFYCPDGQLFPTTFVECSTEDSADDSYRLSPSQEASDNR